VLAFCSADTSHPRRNPRQNGLAVGREATVVLPLRAAVLLAHTELLEQALVVRQPESSSQSNGFQYATCLSDSVFDHIFDPVCCDVGAFLCWRACNRYAMDSLDSIYDVATYGTVPLLSLSSLPIDDGMA